MSTVIDEKIVAGAQDPKVIKEDPIVLLTVCFLFYFNFFFTLNNHKFLNDFCFFVFKDKVKSLYLFRDRYFENHAIESAINKSKDVELEMKNTLAKFDECNLYEIDGARAKYYYLKGKTFNVVDKFTPQAEELLSKAVKLEPKLIEAWNELGECYWKNDDIQQAKNCFIGALPHVRTFYYFFQSLTLFMLFLFDDE